MVREQHRLRALQVRVAGQHGVLRGAARRRPSARCSRAERRRRARRTRRAARAAGRARPGRCGCGRCAACRRAARSARSAGARSPCGCPRRRGRKRKRPASSSRATRRSPRVEPRVPRAASAAAPARAPARARGCRRCRAGRARGRRGSEVVNSSTMRAVGAVEAAGPRLRGGAARVRRRGGSSSSPCAALDERPDAEPQPGEPDEAAGVRLAVAARLVEARQLRVVERARRLAADGAHAALVELAAARCR